MKKISDAVYERERIYDRSNLVMLTTWGASAHFHPQMEILCVSSGAITTTINDEVRLMRRGDIGISDSFDVHSFRVEEPGSVGHILIVPKSFLTEYSALSKNSTFVSHFFSHPQAFKIIESLVLMLREHSPGCDELFGKGILLSIMSLIRANLPSQACAEKNHESLMRDVLSHIYDHSDENITLGLLAKKFGYTPNHFSHIFNAYAQTGLKEYLNILRVDRAAAFLLNGETVLDAAMNAGFDSLRTFYRAFSKRFSTSPNAYINQPEATKR
ncbi:MAG: AraC family transcriptional regulator [Clostridiales bacterium]|nr:AraC family transcriptional regulator [Clostridiales bacterium]